MATTRSILFIQTAFLGDVVLATSALEAWHKAHPSDLLDVLVRRPMEGVFEAHPFVRRVLAWDKRPRFKGRDWRRLVRETRKARYDVVVNLHRHSSSGVLTALSMAPARLGYANNPLAWRFTHRIPHQWGEGTHEVQRHVDLLSAYDSQAFGQAVANPKLHPAEHHRAEADALESRGALLVMPGSQWATKAWPEGQFAKLLDRLQGRVLLMGAPSEHDLCARLAQGRNHVVNCAGALSLLGLAAAVGMARGVVANDSAPLHVASAMNTPTVALFASTVPRFGFGPRASKHKVVEPTPELACRPCGVHGRKRCPEGHFRCGWELSVEDVNQAIQEVCAGDEV